MRNITCKTLPTFVALFMQWNWCHTSVCREEESPRNLNDRVKKNGLFWKEYVLWSAILRPSWSDPSSSSYQRLGQIKLEKNKTGKHIDMVYINQLRVEKDVELSEGKWKYLTQDTLCSLTFTLCFHFGEKSISQTKKTFEIPSVLVSLWANVHSMILSWNLKY